MGRVDDRNDARIAAEKEKERESVRRRQEMAAGSWIAGQEVKQEDELEKERVKQEIKENEDVSASRAKEEYHAVSEEGSSSEERRGRITSGISSRPPSREATADLRPTPEELRLVSTF